MRTRPARHRGGPGEVAGDKFNLEGEEEEFIPDPKNKSAPCTFPDSARRRIGARLQDAKPSRHHSFEAGKSAGPRCARIPAPPAEVNF